jgi:BirA family biotin operon repressor/biotin-[acetyl-CoA-carboxylase] ligase
MDASPYTDLTRPPLHESGLSRALVAGGLWTELRVVAETGSTNADAAAAARAHAPEGLVVIAESQTAGRGRLDRGWMAPPRSSITLSVLLRPQVPVARLGWLPLLAGVALVEVVDRIASVDAALKWPNDLLVRATGATEYGKCAGVLAEAVDGAVVLGIGLNVSQRADELPPGRVGFAATSLALAGALGTDRDPLVRALLRDLAHWYGRWVAADGDCQASGLADAYRANCVTIGRQVAVELPGGQVVAGPAEGVDGDGRLIVATPDGPRAMAAGDIRHVR